MKRLKGNINLVLQHWLSCGKPVFNFIRCLYIFFPIVLYNSISFFRMQNLLIMDLNCIRIPNILFPRSKFSNTT